MFLTNHTNDGVKTNTYIKKKCPLTSNTFILNRLANEQAKLAYRTCAERAKLKTRTVHANTDPNYDLAHKLVLKIGFCTAQLGLLISKFVPE